MENSKPENQQWRAGSFTIVGYFDDKPMRGYTNGKQWVGSERPFFELEEANRIARKYPDIKYDSDNDVFIWPNEEGDEAPVVFEAINVVIDGQEKRLYGIGAGYWTWDEVPIE